MTIHATHDTRSRLRSRRLPRRATVRVTLLATLLACAALAAAPPAGAGRATDMGVSAAEARRVLHEHTLRTLDGGTLPLGSLAGQVVVLNFWASWCPPCRRELPRLGRLQQQLSGTATRVIAVSIDDDADNARRFCRAQGIGFTVAHDGPDGLARALDLKHIPCTLIMDRAGNVAYTTSGSDDAAIARLATTTRQLLAQSPPTADAGDAR